MLVYGTLKTYWNNNAYLSAANPFRLHSKTHKNGKQIYN